MQLREPMRSAAKAMTIELTFCGGFSARVAGVSVAIPTRKAQALLVYLALTPDFAHEREKLCGLLWGEATRERAHGSLRQSLFSLRKVLAGAATAALVTNGRTIALNPSGLRVDALLLERCVAEGTRAALEQAAVLYRGPLLDGFATGEGPFDEWLSFERTRYAELASVACERLAELQAKQGELECALQTRQQRARLEPWNEENHRQLMLLYMRLGRRAAALAHYRQCVAVLERELGVEPELASRTLYQEIVRPDASCASHGAPSGPRDAAARA